MVQARAYAGKLLQEVDWLQGCLEASASRSSAETAELFRRAKPRKPLSFGIVAGGGKRAVDIFVDKHSGSCISRSSNLASGTYWRQSTVWDTFWAPLLNRATGVGLAQELSWALGNASNAVDEHSHAPQPPAV